ncbi:MAG: 3-deoxy-D-manno-octulosonic acid kinase [Alteromonadaceae bacterium]|nr:3-deoxy-D-manno-octulosonic acid kinase [Alteromonadaceae bacterium]
MVKPCKLNTYQHGAIYCQYDENKLTEFSPQLFNSDYWQQKNAITGSAQGRGTTWFIEHNKQAWVLRHYYRGGLVGKFIKDSYFYQGMTKTRAVQEFNLLAKMQQLALPAPAPVAYQVIRSGLFYYADLLSQRIENAHDLVAILSIKTLSSTLWQRIGETIQQFHQHGIYHHDLNVHNILIDDNDKVWLIDFDRGEQRTINKSWQQANLRRLLRSFNKEKNKLPNFQWQPQDWQQLLMGYKI